MGVLAEQDGFNLDEIGRKMSEEAGPVGLAQEARAAFSAIVEAGEVLLSYARTGFRINFKGRIDLVTDADLASEKVILHALKGIEEVEILAEEDSGSSPVPGKWDLSPGRYWIVDPLDGTTNFAHFFPMYAVSIALTQVDSSASCTPLLGMVYLPRLKELFWGLKGRGAWLNCNPISVSTQESMERSLLATGFPYDIHEDSGDVIDAFSKMIVRAQGIRRAGAAAIDLAYVAAGRFEGFWEMKLKPWDTAAGWLLIQEAGGQVSDFQGRPFTPFFSEVAASNSHIHKEMIRLLSDYSIGR